MSRLFSLALATAALCAGAATANVTPERLDAQVKAYVDQEKFNGAVLVAKDGKIILSKGYGMANYEWKIPNTPTTKFRLGSVTKQFTATLVLQLEQQGKLSVNDPISKYVEGSPERWQAITIHHLLTHTSGIPNFTSFPDYQKTMMMVSPPKETIKRVVDKPLDFDPGTKFSYSNSGYVLLGMIIEKVTGKSYADVLQEQITGPLGMKDTGYDIDRTLIPNRAAGYERAGKVLRNASFIDMTIPHGAGALYSTVEDLKKWDEALLTDKLLPSAAREKMFTAFKDTYAYGWDVRTVDGRKVVSHGGGINGFATMIRRIPEERLLVVTLSNVLPSQAGKVASDLEDLMLGKTVAVPAPKQEIKLQASLMDEYVGEYALSETFIMTVSREGEQMFIQATGQGKIPVFASAKDKVFPKVVDADVEFQRGPDGKVNGLVLKQGGREMPGKRR